MKVEDRLKILDNKYDFNAIIVALVMLFLSLLVMKVI